MACSMTGTYTMRQVQTLIRAWRLSQAGIRQLSSSRTGHASAHTSHTNRCLADHGLVLLRNVTNKKQRQFLCVSPAALVRFNSSAASAGTNTANVTDPTVMINPTDYIPPPPPLPDASTALSDMAGVLNELGEPTLQSLGLASFWPSGLVQQGLELLHVSLGLPWWGSIVVGTVLMRMLMFPIVIKSQQLSINLMNHMPTVQKLQVKFTQARQRGNMLEAIKYGSELQDYMKRNNVKPFGQILMPLCQMPVFLSVFVGLRGMANLPVESMKEGGLLWFTDLTVTGPFYGLPLLTSLTFWLTIEVGADGISAQSQAHVIKWVLRAMPVIMLPFISNFASAMLVYWFTSNTFSLLQVSFLKVPQIKEFFKIPERVVHPIEPSQKTGFLEGFKEAYSNMKASQQVMERQRLDDISFRKAAHGPITKTYSYNPKKVETPQKLVSEAIKAKER